MLFHQKILQMLLTLIAGLLMPSLAQAGAIQFQSTFTSAQLSTPFGISADGSGNLFVTNIGNNQVVEFNSAHNLVTNFGGSVLSSPYGDTVAANGTLYVLDTGHNRVQSMTTTGTAGGTFGTLSAPHGIFSDANSNIFVADTSNNRILKYNSAGTLQLTIAPSGGTAFSSPFGVAVDAGGSIYVADTFNNRVEIFDGSGTFIRSFSTVIPSWSDTHPKELTLGSDGTIYMSLGDPGFAAFTNGGTLINAIGGFDRASGVVVYGNSLYGVDLGNNRVAVFSLPEPSGLSLAGMGAIGLLSGLRWHNWRKRRERVNMKTQDGNLPSMT